MKRFGTEELQAVQEVIRKGELSSFFRDFRGGKYVQAFEEAFAEYHDVKHAISTSSGTSALHTALLATGVKQNDEVITTPYTFVATASTILMCNARPVFCDVDLFTYNLDPTKMTVLPTTKAIIPVHLLGHPANMDYINEIAQDAGISVIEDSCQALGAKYKGKLCGTLGDLGIFSFQHTKTITTAGEGGMIITDDKKLAERCRYIRNHGEKYAPDPRNLMIGYNYRMTETQAAFGLAQLGKLDKLNEVQIENATYMCKNLPKGITPPYVAPYAEHVYFLIGAQFNAEIVGISREEYLKRLEDVGLVQRKPAYNVSGGYDRLLYTLPALMRYKAYCPIAERLTKTSLWIDLHRFKPLGEVKVICEKMKEALEI